MSEEKKGLGRKNKCAFCPDGGLPESSLFAFPTDPLRRKEWEDILQVDPLTPVLHPKLCSIHFRPNQFTSAAKIRLKKDAVPRPKPRTHPQAPPPLRPMTSSAELQRMTTMMSPSTTIPNPNPFVRLQRLSLPTRSTPSILGGSSRLTSNPLPQHGGEKEAEGRRESPVTPTMDPTPRFSSAPALVPGSPTTDVGCDPSGPGVSEQLQLLTQLQPPLLGWEWVYLGIGPAGVPLFTQLQLHSPPLLQIFQVECESGAVDSQSNSIPSETSSSPNPPSPPVPGTGPCEHSAEGESYSMCEKLPLLLSTSTATTAHSTSTVDTSESNSIPEHLRSPTPIPSLPGSGPNKKNGEGESCLMCENPPILLSIAIAPHSTRTSAELLLMAELYSVTTTFLQLLNMDRPEPRIKDGDEEEEGALRRLLPICSDCFPQVKTLVDAHHELRKMQEHFHTLKTEVIQAMTSKFCRTRGTLDEETQRRLRKRVFRARPTPTKVIPKEPPSLERGTDFHMDSPFPGDVGGDDGIKDGEDSDYGMDLDMDMEMDEDVEEREGDVLPAPTHFDSQVYVCFDGRLKSRQLRIRDRWKALWECPETRGGVEELIPFYFRRVTCPICGDKVPPLRLEHHFSAQHSNYDPEGMRVLREKLLSFSAVMLNGKERWKIIRVKFRKLAQWSAREGVLGEHDAVIPQRFRIVKCHLCAKEMLYETLEDHLRMHRGEKIFTCEECGRSFSRIHYLYVHRRAHLNEVNNMNRKFNCDLCPRRNVVTRMIPFLVHLKTYHSSLVEGKVLFFHNCDFPSCPHSFRGEEDLVTHLATHSSNEQPFFCPKDSCPKVFALVEHMREHVERTGHDETQAGSQSQRPPVFPCTYCLRILNNESDWKSHESTHGVDVAEDDRPHLCETCGNGFRTHVDLKRHLKVSTHDPRYLARIPRVTPNTKRRVSAKIPRDPKTKAPPKRKRVEGDEVEKQPRTKKKRIRPRRPPVLRPPPKFYNQHGSCHLCGKRMTGVLTLKLHLLNIHTYENHLECYICRKTFRQLQFLELHIRRHLGQPSKSTRKADMKCMYCGQDFGNVYAVRKHHIQLHGDEYLSTKPFFCPVCFLRVETEDALAKHQQEMHEGCKCNVCGKQCFNSFRHKLHMRTHTGEKPYECKWCSKTFSYITNLQEHEIMRHTRELPHQCGECGKRFLRKKTLNDHVTKDH